MLFIIRNLPALVIGAAIGFSLSFTPYANKIIRHGEKAKNDTSSAIKKRLMKVGVPKFSIALEREGYICEYNPKTRNPLWTYEHLTAKGLQANTSRALFKFNEDPLVPEIFRSKLGDYHGSTYERAHLCPPADQRSDPKLLGETFYLSNVSPQVPELKQGFWKNFEREIRAWTANVNCLDIFTGPLFLPVKTKEGLRVQYSVIGESEVAVPTHFFKVILVEKGRNNFDVRAYIIPNQSIGDKVALNEFEVPLQAVERASGIKFFDKVTLP